MGALVCLAAREVGLTSRRARGRDGPATGAWITARSRRATPAPKGGPPAGALPMAAFRPAAGSFRLKRAGPRCCSGRAAELWRGLGSSPPRCRANASPTRRPTGSTWPSCGASSSPLGLVRAKGPTRSGVSPVVGHCAADAAEIPTRGHIRRQVSRPRGERLKGIGPPRGCAPIHSRARKRRSPIPRTAAPLLPAIGRVVHGGARGRDSSPIGPRWAWNGPTGRHGAVWPRRWAAAQPPAGPGRRAVAADGSIRGATS
jgi:hypothetical protein